MNDRVAIVTGGTGALGRKIVEKFSDEGIKVYVPARSLEEFNSVFDSSKSAMQDVFKLRRIFSFVCNAIDENSVQDFVENVSTQERGRIDYLINTIGGISARAYVEEISSQALDDSIDLNLKSTFYFSKAVLKVMKGKGFGRIISIGAIAALEITTGRFPYSFSKAGVINLMDTISEENKDLDIRCNTIIPSIIDTAANREWGNEEEIQKWVTPEQISEIIYNLISNGFSALRSSHIKVYGSF